MWKPLKKFKEYREALATSREQCAEYEEEIIEMDAENKTLEAIVVQLQKDLKNPKKVIEAIYGKGLDWYDPIALPAKKYETFLNEATSIRRSEVAHNIKNLLVATWGQEALESADDPNDPQHTKRLAWCVVGIEAFFQYIDELSEHNISDESEA